MSKPRWSFRATTIGLVAVLLLSQGVAYAGAPLAEPAPGTPITDPIPEDPVDAHTALTIAEVATFPKSEPIPPPNDARLRRWARINYVGELPDHSGRLYVPDLNGKLYLMKNGVPHEYLDVGTTFAPDFFSGRGLGTGFGFVTFHPDFRHNGRFYTVHSEAGAALTTRTPDFAQKVPFVHSVVTEWTAKNPAADTFEGTHREILRISFDSQIHGIQQIDFNPTAGRHDKDYGLLYLAVGDGGIGYLNDDPQNKAIPHGKILRIDPRGHDSANGKYGVPRSNPFVGKPGALGEIYALGMRDPHRFSWDSQATWEWDGHWPTLRHRLFLGHIGEHDIEAVYDVKAGDNLGWSEREGPFVFNKADRCNLYPLPADDKTYGYTYPVAAYDHNAPADWPCTRDVGRAISGGFVYHGRKIPSLRGKYVFADLVDGRLLYTNAAEMRRGGKLATIHELKVVNSAGWPVKMADIVGDARVDLRIGADSDGELYLLAKSNGKVWKVTGARRTPPRADVLPSLQRNLVAYYDFEHPAVHNPAQELDQGRGGTTINLVNGGAQMRVADGANPSSAHSLQVKQVNPTVAGGNDDWKAGVYSATGVPTLHAFNATKEATVAGWFKMNGENPSPNPGSSNPNAKYGAIGLTGVLTGDSDGHAVRALLELINVDGVLKVVALGRRVDGASSQTFAASLPWPEILPQNEWVFLAATFDYDNATMALYKNGKPLAGSYVLPDDPWVVNGPPEPDLTSATDPRGIKIGGSFPQNTREGNPCNCRMDSLMYLNRAATAREIELQYRRVTRDRH